ncbi:MAG TPA: hypothetical protein VGV61_10290 [Thermoanaerobaculia bacterium]|jgi:hypothetical protein|nr:hypothetical protein [Thermoanaerobaculia bacterium]
MKTMALFVEPADCTASLKTTPTDDVLTYVAFLRRWTPTGPFPAGQWNSGELEAGVTLRFGDDLGYDLIVKAAVRLGGEAGLGVDIAFAAPGAGGFHKMVALPDIEGPVVERSWKTVIR